MDRDNRGTIEEIKQRLDIVATIDKYVKLKQAGKNFSGLCPFHNEKSPSFIVSPDIQRYKCFGCGKSGDIFTFIQEVETLDFKQTLEKLAKEAGITLEKDTTYSKYAWLEWINENAADFYAIQLNLPVYKDHLAYLTKRGINSESIKQFKIGYAPKQSPLIAYIQEKSKNRLKKDQLLQSGLFVEKTGKLRDKFNDRIVFPIWDLGGKVVGFSGRQTPLNTFGPKYLNTPETALFHKSYTLLGIYQGKNFIRKEDLAILCEGNLDVISAHQMGLKNLVAPMGTAITASQLDILKRYTNNVLFFFDSDDAGQKAVERGFKLAAPMELNCFATNPEPYQDIDEMIQKDPELAKDKIANKLDAFTYLISAKLEKLSPANNLTDLNNLVKYVAFLLADTENQAIRDFYIQKAATISKVDIADLLVKQAKSSRYSSYAKRDDEPATHPAENAQNQSQPAIDPEKQLNQKITGIIKTSPRRELAYLHIILTYSLFTPLKGAQFIPEVFTTTEISEILEYIKRTDVKKVAELLSEGTTKLSELAKRLISEVVLKNELYIGTDPEPELELIYKNLELEYLEKKLKQISSQLAIAEERGDEKEINRIVKESTDLAQIVKIKKQELA